MKTRRPPRTSQLPVLGEAEVAAAIGRLKGEKPPWLLNQSAARGEYLCQAFIRWVHVYVSAKNRYSLSLAAATMPRFRSGGKQADRTSFSEAIQSLGPDYADASSSPKKPPTKKSLELFRRVLTSGPDVPAGGPVAEDVLQADRPRQALAFSLETFALSTELLAKAQSELFAKRPFCALQVLGFAAARIEEERKQTEDDFLVGRAAYDIQLVENLLVQWYRSIEESSGFQTFARTTQEELMAVGVPPDSRALYRHRFRPLGGKADEVVLREPMLYSQYAFDTCYGEIAEANIEDVVLRRHWKHVGPLLRQEFDRLLQSDETLRKSLEALHLVASELEDQVDDATLALQSQLREAKLSEIAVVALARAFRDSHEPPGDFPAPPFGWR